MECNRDEATRAKEIAEQKFSKKDIMGAKKFALKAQALYPELEGISQFLAILDVYVAVEDKINGELDFYGILGVHPLADDDIVRKSYRKLALSLHPDKNKSIGADGAFKYVSEAWSFLSDKEKRLAYDRKRNFKVLKPKAPTQNGGSRASAHNGFHNFTKSTTSKAKGTTTNAATKTGPASVPAPAPVPKTFWTVCKKCVMQYEFVRMYVNRKLLCPGCHEPFLAIETPPPGTNGSIPGPSSTTGVEPGLRGSANQTTFQWVPFPKKTSPAAAAQAATMVQRAYEKVKREREEAQAAVKLNEASKRKKIAKKAEKSVNYSSSGHLKTGTGPLDSAEASKDDPNIGIKNRLIKKATTEIRNKLNEWSEKQKSVNENSSDVPDPDFHDFDRDRAKTCFEEGQVWAAYDENDGMARYYTMIRKVISLDPFKMKISWLDPKPDSDPGPVSKSSKAFGDFKLGKHETVSIPNYFSHKINFTKQPNGTTIRVFPRKGDVWALYGTHQTPNLTKQKYEIVEVDGYDEETGITVTPLVKVSRFKTVFRRQVNERKTRVVPENEMFRFSHQIPSYLLTGQESTSAPKGCRELDPAGIPIEFLKVIENGKNMEEKDVLADIKEARSK